MRIASPNVPELWPLTHDADRGIYRSRHRRGRYHLYYAIDSHGEMIETRLPRAGRSAARCVVELDDLLALADPVRPALRLMRAGEPASGDSASSLAWSSFWPRHLRLRPPHAP